MPSFSRGQPGNAPTIDNLACLHVRTFLGNQIIDTCNTEKINELHQEKKDISKWDFSRLFFSLVSCWIVYVLHSFPICFYPINMQELLSGIVILCNLQM